MKQQKSEWLKHALTDYDNTTYDTGRILAFGYFVSAVVFTAWAVMVKGHPFVVQEYLLGGGTFLTGLGFYLFGDGKGKEAGGTTTTTSATITETTPKGS